MEITWRVISGKGGGRMGEKVQGIRTIIGRYKIDRERLRINLGNGEAKTLYEMLKGLILSLIHI